MAAGEVLLLDVEDAAESALLQREHVDPGTRRLDPGRVADDVDQPVDRVQTAEQIIVLAVAARQERREVAEADALQALDALETLERARILRADAVDQDLVELTELARAGDRKGQHVPERKAQVVDQHLAPGL